MHEHDADLAFTGFNDVQCWFDKRRGGLDRMVSALIQSLPARSHFDLPVIAAQTATGHREAIDSY